MARAKHSTNKKASAKPPSRIHSWSDFSRPLTEADEAQIFGHIPANYPPNRSRPLPDADKALIKEEISQGSPPLGDLEPPWRPFLRTREQDEGAGVGLKRRCGDGGGL